MFICILTFNFIVLHLVLAVLFHKHLLLFTHDYHFLYRPALSVLPKSSVINANACLTHWETSLQQNGPGKKILTALEAWAANFCVVLII